MGDGNEKLGNGGLRGNGGRCGSEESKGLWVGVSVRHWLYGGAGGRAGVMVGCGGVGGVCLNLCVGVVVMVKWWGAVRW